MESEYARAPTLRRALQVEDEETDKAASEAAASVEKVLLRRVRAK